MDHGRGGADPFPVLTDGTVTLREQSRGDLADIVAMCRDPEAVRWTTVPDPYTVADGEAYLAQAAENRRHGTPLAWAIEVAGRFQGNVDLRLDGARGAEVGYLLAPWGRHQRLSSRALRLILGWAFEHLELDVVRWRAEVGNWPSRRTAWAVGFRFEGRQRGLLPARGAARGAPPLDAWVGSIARGEPLRPAHPWLTPPVVSGSRVTLRAPAPQDVPRIVEACRDPWTRHFVTAVPEPYGEDDARAYLGQVAEEHAVGVSLTWAITCPPDDALAGVITVAGLAGAGAAAGDVARRGLATPEAGVIGYWSHPAVRGRGVTSEALRLVARHALLPQEVGGLGLPSVHLEIAPDNAASLAVARAAGFRPQGLRRRHERARDGAMRDLVLLDLTPEDLPAAQDPPSGRVAAAAVSSGPSGHDERAR